MRHLTLPASLGLLLALGCQQNLGSQVTAQKSTNADPHKDDHKKEAKGSAKQAAKEDDDHDHVHGHGPHGGLIFDLGKFHAEINVDHKKGECSIYVVGEDQKTYLPVAATELILTTKPTKTEDGKPIPSFTFTLLPQKPVDGKASHFLGTDPGIKTVVEFAGTVVGEIDGKPSKGTFEEHGH